MPSLAPGAGFDLPENPGEPGVYSLVIPTPIEAWPDGTDVKVTIVDEAGRVVGYQPARVYQGDNLPLRGHLTIPIVLGR